MKLSELEKLKYCFIYFPTKNSALSGVLFCNNPLKSVIPYEDNTDVIAVFQLLFSEMFQLFGVFLASAVCWCRGQWGPRSSPLFQSLCGGFISSAGTPDSIRALDLWSFLPADAIGRLDSSERSPIRAEQKAGLTSLSFSVLNIHQRLSHLNCAHSMNSEASSSCTLTLLFCCDHDLLIPECQTDKRSRDAEQMTKLVPSDIKKKENVSKHS